jgi:hypothetical protein
MILLERRLSCCKGGETSRQCCCAGAYGCVFSGRSTARRPIADTWSPQWLKTPLFKDFPTATFVVSALNAMKWGPLHDARHYPIFRFLLPLDALSFDQWTVRHFTFQSTTMAHSFLETLRWSAPASLPDQASESSLRSTQSAQPCATFGDDLGGGVDVGLSPCAPGYVTPTIDRSAAPPRQGPRSRCRSRPRRNASPAIPTLTKYPWMPT